MDPFPTSIIGFLIGSLLAMLLRTLDIIRPPRWFISERSAPQILLQEVDERWRQQLLHDLVGACIAPEHWLRRQDALASISTNSLVSVEALGTNEASILDLTPSEFPVSPALVIFIMLAIVVCYSEVPQMLKEQSTPEQAEVEATPILAESTSDVGASAPHRPVSYIFNYTYPLPTGPGVRLPTPSPPLLPVVFPTNWPPIHASNPTSPAAWHAVPPRSASVPAHAHLTDLLSELPPALAQSSSSIPEAELATSSDETPSTLELDLRPIIDAASNASPPPQASDETTPSAATSTTTCGPSADELIRDPQMGESSTTGVGLSSASSSAEPLAPEPLLSTDIGSPIPSPATQTHEPTLPTPSTLPLPDHLLPNEVPVAPEPLPPANPGSYGNGRGRGRGGHAEQGGFRGWWNSVTGRGRGRGLPDVSRPGRMHENWQERRNWRYS